MCADERPGFGRDVMDRSSALLHRGRITVAKRPRYSRWRRLPPVFRSGEKNWPRPDEEEQRVSLYLPGSVLDLAEAQANRSGAGTIQDYCTDLLQRAIEVEQAREQVADLEARRGALEGLHEIANDPEYLAEWSARTGPRDRPADSSSTRIDLDPAVAGGGAPPIMRFTNVAL